MKALLLALLLVGMAVPAMGAMTYDYPVMNAPCLRPGEPTVVSFYLGNNVRTEAPPPLAEVVAPSGVVVASVDYVEYETGERQYGYANVAFQVNEIGNYTLRAATYDAYYGTPGMEEKVVPTSWDCSAYKASVSHGGNLTRPAGYNGDNLYLDATCLAVGQSALIKYFYVEADDSAYISIGSDKKLRADMENPSASVMQRPWTWTTAQVDTLYIEASTTQISQDPAYEEDSRMDVAVAESCAEFTPPASAGGSIECPWWRCNAVLIAGVGLGLVGLAVALWARAEREAWWDDVAIGAGVVAFLGLVTSALRGEAWMQAALKWVVGVFLVLMLMPVPSVSAVHESPAPVDLCAGDSSCTQEHAGFDDESVWNGVWLKRLVVCHVERTATTYEARYQAGDDGGEDAIEVWNRSRLSLRNTGFDYPDYFIAEGDRTGREFSLNLPAGTWTVVMDKRTQMNNYAGGVASMDVRVFAPGEECNYTWDGCHAYHASSWDVRLNECFAEPEPAKESVSGDNATGDPATTDTTDYEPPFRPTSAGGYILADCNAWGLRCNLVSLLAVVSGGAGGVMAYAAARQREPWREKAVAAVSILGALLVVAWFLREPFVRGWF